METTELFYPEISVELGAYTFTEGIEIEVYSNKDSYFDWAKIRFTEEFKDKLNLAAKEKALIQLGYNGVFDDVFEGYITKPYDSGEYMNEILLKDDMIFLEETTINNTFLDTTPQEIISYCLSKTGIKNMKLSAVTYPAKARLAIFQKSVISVINDVHAAWGIKDNFFFSGGIFYWGEKPGQTKVFSFEYGTNIIALNRSGGIWELETVSAPFIKHSQKISVSHPQVSGEFEVKKVVFTTNEAGFIRTYIYF
ncbi:hypothetical protein LY28_02768 [Ruminiclostridium sufflavum DSM 19573]|uniref:Serine/arginine repetitive matrix protein 2 n=1 Tax=Ruminiclostridium sufflavum DSM 19573 TaxID=1121337 RepID=A0A318XL78_9FIRM|nr:serine/arginine repetitive matrix protein 2 [Ruminiclostridium sufflavum]PYG86742.1 hypothetical protein LY28_02768 [Ruminiclostridium sufflavum DSM 19573]